MQVIGFLFSDTVCSCCVASGLQTRGEIRRTGQETHFRGQVGRDGTFTSGKCPRGEQRTEAERGLKARKEGGIRGSSSDILTRLTGQQSRCPVTTPPTTTTETG